MLVSPPSLPLEFISRETWSEPGEVISRDRGCETRDKMVRGTTLPGYEARTSLVPRYELVRSDTGSSTCV